MTRVAIIGTGVAGLSAAYGLCGKADIVLFESGDCVGGHAHTEELEDEPGKTIGLDTAFVVFNALSYPNFCAFLEETAVPYVPHLGGFSFWDRVAGVEYGSAELEQGGAQLASRYPAWLCSVIDEAKRFHRESGQDMARGEADAPLGAYLDARGYSQAFRDAYIGLLSTAVWSVPPALIWDMPASTVIAFFYYHGEGGLGGKRVDWRSVQGGSISYVRRLLDIVKPDIRLNTPVASIREIGEHVEVRSAAGSEQFDYVVLATHADQALAILGDNATEWQRHLLSQVRYHSTRVVLHTDASVMPADRGRWMTWNYGQVATERGVEGYVAYYLNRVQGLDSRNDYFLTLDYPLPLESAKVIREFDYSHPVIDMAVRKMQGEIYSLNHQGRVKLCGSYFHSRELGADLIGSHEAAFSSGAEAAKSVLGMMQSPVENWLI
ncbi:NAD(P)/FAD-dependent oxidoreductase [Pseudoduganella namucuonensis]|uniref:Predicted NAD/FAD-binding protein n=1 Tax=Pseudoduganella namucuonensis TaxID=1035707 RepID=A0A1I7FKJ5_9BURK|nr:FAD-dependent oxidoreductase [Pseudoduganella namucuonensis]SFU36717.1 Predicted NAD/FAD-binding protein [Pseudoduganella namucuonensis]